MSVMLKPPEEVFTPRSGSVNPSMYIARPELERELKQALRGSRHIIVHGVSGSGKSWLYKQVLYSEGASFEVVDLANASRFGSITKEFENLLSRIDPVVQSAESKTRSGGASIKLLSGDMSESRQFEVLSRDPFERLLECIAGRAKLGPKVMVWDNFEAILSQSDLIREAANIISLVDNEHYSRHRVRILIVGVPKDIRLYLSRVEQQNTVSNRLTELSEVTRMDGRQVEELIRKGFRHELGCSIEDDEIEDIGSRVAYLTDRIPQYVQDYCLELALAWQEDGEQFSADLFDEADRRWILSSLVAAYTAVESHMNSYRTTAGRKNQVLYALGLCNSQDFHYRDIEKIVRGEFPQSTEGTTLNVSGILQGLTQGDRAILQRTPRGDEFSFINPIHRMVIRVGLLRHDDESISICPLES